MNWKIKLLLILFGIKVKYTDNIKSGQWKGDSYILINKEKADNYVYLHEIGHYLYGYDCCREHCEFAAHGIAIALGKILRIKFDNEIWDRAMNGYSGFSFCPREQLIRENK